MGSSQIRVNNKEHISEDCKKEYFKVAKKDFSEGMKRINSTIHTSEEPEDNWIHFLMEKFDHYLKSNKLNKRHLQQIVNYLENIEASSEIIHIHNLSLYLSREIDDMSQTVKRKQSIIDRYYTEEEFKSNNTMLNISKDEMLWKGGEFILQDIEDINHPINNFISNLQFILSEVYERDYQKLMTEFEKEKRSNDSLYHSAILFEANKGTTRKLSKCSCYGKNVLTEENTKSVSDNSFILAHTHSLSEQKISQFYQDMQNEIINFSNFIAGAVVRFYSIKSTTSPKLFEIFCDKMKDLLIRKDLYSLIYKIKSHLQIKKKELYSEGLIEYYNIKPHYLCISPYFTLDKKFRNSILEHIVIPSTLKPKDLISTIPYHKSILLFRQISETDSIIKKIDIMFKLRGSILSEIDEFWKDIPLKSKYKSVDADNLLSIFIYLTIKSQISSLITDLEIIEDFTNRNMKLSRKGYFFNLFQSSTEYLIDTLSKNQIENNITEYNIHLNKELTILENKSESILDLSKLLKSYRRDHSLSC